MFDWKTNRSWWRRNKGTYRSKPTNNDSRNCYSRLNLSNSKLLSERSAWDRELGRDQDFLNILREKRVDILLLECTNVSLCRINYEYWKLEYVFLEISKFTFGLSLKKFRQFSKINQFDDHRANMSMLHDRLELSCKLSSIESVLNTKQSGNTFSGSA